MLVALGVGVGRRPLEGFPKRVESDALVFAAFEEDFVRTPFFASRLVLRNGLPADEVWQASGRSQIRLLLRLLMLYPPLLVCRS